MTSDASGWSTRLLGKTIGLALAPVAYIGSAIRSARLFHPHGQLCSVDLTPCAPAPFLGLAKRLHGPAVVRLSGGAFKSDVEFGEVLGCALRVTAPQGMQDLMFGSFKTLWQLPLAPLLTNGHDYFCNDYYAAADFAVDGVGTARFRLRSLDPDAVPGSSRPDRLARRIETGKARFMLEGHTAKGGNRWAPIAGLTLTAFATSDPDALAFSVKHSACGIRPGGLLNFLRTTVYDASQKGRDSPTTKAGGNK